MSSWIARRRLRQGTKVRQEADLPTDWNFTEDADDMINTTIANQWIEDVSAVSYRRMDWDDRRYHQSPEFYQDWGRNWGTLINKYIENPDTLIALKYMHGQGYGMNKAVRCLLYTSPSPRDS